MLSTQEVKDYARHCGADIVGIASMDRFEGAPKQMDPRYIFPDAKAMIVLGFRILRGAFRGIEEGTFFTAYSGMGYAAINWIHQPMVLWHLGAWLEDNGYESVPIPNLFPWSNTDTVGLDPEKTGKVRENWSRPVSPDKPAPDVFVQLRIAAFCAGLGEIGYSKLLLTPEFGPRQRLAAMLTDAPLEPDPIYDGPPLCDKCKLCARDCTGNAISKTETVKVVIAGRDVEWGKIDMEKCSMAFCGANKEFNPFQVTEEDEKGFNEAPYATAQKYKIGPLYSYGRALEGARGCMRACMVHLEERGVLKNTFKNPFRTRKPWRLAP